MAVFKHPQSLGWRDVERMFKTAWSKMPKRSRDEWQFYLDINGNLIATYPDLPEYLWIASKNVWVEIPSR